jgi:exosortase A-associated hydrolase 2
MTCLPSPEAFFIPSPEGDLFALYFQPDNGLEEAGSPAKKAILFIPPFAEEMNKARRMVALQARAFCQQGYAVLLLDLFGTGDSQGDFSEAKWSTWLANIETAYHWLRDKGIEDVSLWGLRVGVLLAMDFLQQHPLIKIDQLIGWQPVLKGELFGAQFLRLRIASAMMDKNAPKEKVADLKARLEAGETIEVAGYSLHPDLMLPLMALEAGQFDLANVAQCHVFEMIAAETQAASVSTRRWVNTMPEMKITLDLVVGSNFWSTQEIVEVPELIEATVNRLEAR